MKQMLGRSNASSAGSGGGGREFLDRHRLAGERRLVDEEVLRGEQAQVRRDHVAGREGDDVAGNDLFHRYLGEAFDLRDVRRTAAALHARSGLDQGAQLGGRFVGAMLLDEGRHDRENHHGGDDHGGAGVAEKVGHHREREQQHIERVLGAIDDLVEDAGPALLGDLVRPEALQPLDRLRFVETRIGTIETARRPRGVASARRYEFGGHGDVPARVRGAYRRCARRRAIPGQLAGAHPAPAQKCGSSRRADGTSVSHGDGVPPVVLGQIGVEGGGDKTNEGAPLLRHHDVAAVATHDAGCAQRVDRGQFR